MKRNVAFILFFKKQTMNYEEIITFLKENYIVTALIAGLTAIVFAFLASRSVKPKKRNLVDAKASMQKIFRKRRLKSLSGLKNDKRW